MNKVKRILAISGILFIASLYLISFISAFFATKYSHGLFAASIFSTLVIPIIIWWSITIYQWSNKGKLTDPQEEASSTEEEKK